MIKISPCSDQYTYYVLNRRLLSSYGSSRGKFFKFLNTENVLNNFLTDTHSICAFSQVKVVRKQLSHNNQVLGRIGGFANPRWPSAIPLPRCEVTASFQSHAKWTSNEFYKLRTEDSYTSRANILTQARHFENLNSLNKDKRRPLIKGCQEKVCVICCWLSNKRLTSLEYSCTVRLKWTLCLDKNYLKFMQLPNFGFLLIWRQRASQAEDSLLGHVLSYKLA